MDPNEREIYSFLKTQPADFFNVREICRRAGGRRRYNEDPEWAVPILSNMAERGIVERDTLGRYRLKPKGKRDKNKRWIAPDIAQILKESGVEVDDAGEVGADDYYEQL